MRLFIAIPMPESVTERLVELQQPIEGVRWQQAQKLHLTLKFLGETNIKGVQKLQDVLGAVNISTFSITLKGFGYFPEGKQPRVLWAGIKENKQLQKLYREIENKCTKLGFDPEKHSFKPHITIARIKNTPKNEVTSFINRHKQFKMSGVPVEEFVLFESKLHPDGAKHFRKKTFNLS